MSQYMALYRKYRPAVFSDVVGQDHITKVLRSEIMQDSVSHAYLFCGSRGTGKTTCAKILAKAISCENPVDGDPCGECDKCRSFESSFDIVEIKVGGLDNYQTTELYLTAYIKVGEEYLYAESGELKEALTSGVTYA